MAEFDTTVNNMVSFYQKHIAASGPENVHKARWEKEVAAILEMQAELKHLRKITKPVPKVLGDISDLPQELIDELSAIKTDSLEDQIFTIINSCEDKEANIDTILVELFRRFQVVQKRTYLTNKLWRMTQKDGVLWAADGKGFYTTVEPDVSQMSDKELDKLIATSPFDLDDEVPF